MADGSIIIPSSHREGDLEVKKSERQGISQSCRKWQSIQEYYRKEDPEHAEELEDLVSKIQSEYLRLSREIEMCKDFS